MDKVLIQSKLEVTIIYNNNSQQRMCIGTPHANLWETYSASAEKNRAVKVMVTNLPPTTNQNAQMRKRGKIVTE